MSRSAVSTWVGYLWGRLRGRAAALAPCRARPSGGLRLFCATVAGVADPGRAPRPPVPHVPAAKRGSPAASIPAQLLVPPPAAGRAETRARGGGPRGGGGGGAAPTLAGAGVMDGEGGARGEGGAPGARGRGGPSLPARCSRRRSEAALSPQRDLFFSFLLNSSSRERLVVTGRAGWMGMGRGAARSALGFWPTLAFLLCSFPAGKALPLARAQLAGPPHPLLAPRRSTGPHVCERVGAEVPGSPRAPASHIHGSLFLARPGEGAMDARGDPRQGCKEKEPRGEVTGAGGASLLPRRGGGPGRRPLGAGEEREKEAWTQCGGHFFRFLAHQSANLPGTRGWSP